MYYKLVGKEIVPTEKFELEGRTVAKTKIGDVMVSTVFLGIDHSFGRGPPMLFETMVFGGPMDQYQERCSTWDEAVEMHERLVARVRSDQ